MSHAPDDPQYRDAVIDLLGALAYAELTAFSQLAADAELAPSQPLKAQMAGVAVREFGHYESIVATLQERGADPESAMAPFMGAIDSFHVRTKPASWLEALVKAYVGNGIASDFYREISRFVDDATREIILAALSDSVSADFAVGEVKAAIRADARVGGRLALYGRRLVGEALSQGQQVAVEQDALANLFIGGVGGVGGGGADLAEIGRMFTRITDNHSERMARLGLAA